ncbi:hypothetical protein ABZ863_05745 [Saccharomonospora sp. NPDC046836]|uniref:hypothetical protein n=1 Tax=Saccharomonospora sp. NPDC046836 TaxID=3156921 RepID=UPI0033EFF718
MLKAAHRRPVLAFGVILLGLVGGCAGEDLSRANFERTTVSAEPGSGQGDVPTGPISDPAVGVSTLRTVDPCALLGSGVVDQLGTAADFYESDWGACRVEVQDAGGKTISVSLDLGESLVLASRASGSIEGLPLVESKLDDTTCIVTAVTSRDPDLGVSAQVGYEGGNACDAGYGTLQRVVQALRAGPPQYQQEPGSLVEVDACTSVDEAVLSDVLNGTVRRTPMGLHECRLADGGQSAVMVRFREGYLPDTDDEGVAPVDLGGTQAVQRQSTIDLAECDVSWLHRPGAEEGMGELAAVTYSDYSDGMTKDDACARAVEVAKTVIPKLPRA